MLNLSQIKTYYPWLDNKDPFILKEYLQYKILQIIYNSKYGSKLVFLWWTALRIGYGNPRFSEDLDFDNLWLSYEEFELLWDIIRSELSKEWLEIETRTIKKWAFHCHIRIPKLLYDNWLANMENTRILIQIDTVPQNHIYTPVIKQLSKFDVITDILVCPIELILAQKLYTVFERKRMKWRDFWDIVFISGITKKPDRLYLTNKIDIKNPQELDIYIQNHIQDLDFDFLQSDVAPFLMDSDNQAVANWPRFISQTKRE